jgi:hypothetical protein
MGGKVGGIEESKEEEGRYNKMGEKFMEDKF